MKPALTNNFSAIDFSDILALFSITYGNLSSPVITKPEKLPSTAFEIVKITNLKKTQDSLQLLQLRISEPV